MLQLIASDELLKLNIFQSEHYDCIDYSTLKKTRVRGSDITKDMLGYEASSNSIVRSFLPYNKYKNDNFRVNIQPYELTVVRNNTDSMKLIIKDNTLKLQNKTIIKDIQNSGQIKVLNCYERKTGDFLIKLYIQGNLIKISIPEDRKIVRLTTKVDNITIPLWNLAEFIANGG